MVQIVEQILNQSVTRFGSKQGPPGIELRERVTRATALYELLEDLDRQLHENVDLTHCTKRFLSAVKEIELDIDRWIAAAQPLFESIPASSRSKELTRFRKAFMRARSRLATTTAALRRSAMQAKRNKVIALKDLPDELFN